MFVPKAPVSGAVRLCGLGLSTVAALLVGLSSCGRDERVVMPDNVDAAAGQPEAGVEREAANPLTPAVDVRPVAEAGPPGAQPIEAGAVDASMTTDAASPPAAHRDGGLDAGSASDASREGSASDAGVFEAGASSEAGVVSEGSGVVRVAGAIQVRGSLILDWDLDTAARAVRSNDTLDVFNPETDKAQPLPSPAWVGGYLGPIALDAASSAALDAGIGASDGGEAISEVPADAGATRTRLDRVDYYRVDLEEGQRVTLFAQPAVLGTSDGVMAPVGAQADLDLYLLDNRDRDISEGGTWVDDSLGLGAVEQVTAPRSRTFWVAVVHSDADTAPAAAARYVLTVAVPLSASQQAQLWQERLSSRDEFQASRALVKLPFGPRESGLAQSLSQVSPENGVGYRTAALKRVVSADPRATILEIKRLRRSSAVEQIEPVLRFQPQGLPQPNDPEFYRQWYTWPIDLLAGWVESERSERPRGEGVIVAVVDTGIVKAHPDFTNADGSSQILDDGYDMIDNVEAAGDDDGRDPDPTDPGDQGVTGGGTFHGTHCAGNIAAATDNAIGIVGVAPRAKILPVRVMGIGGGTLDDVVEGVLFAAGLPNASGALPERRADVINLSLAGRGRSTMMADTVAAARAAGSIVIAAAGNFGQPVEAYTPASEPGVVTVGAVDADLRRAWYSNYAESDGFMDIAAVGGDSRVDHTLDGFPDGVWSTLFRDGGATLYGDIEGTSMSAAQVSGVAAMMKAAWPEMTPDQFQALLPEMVTDIGDPGKDWDFGHGLLNAPRAVAAALAAAGDPDGPRAVLHVSAHALDFGTEFSSLPFDISNQGGGELLVESVISDQPWLILDPGAIGSNRVRVDRSAAALGVNWGALHVFSNVGSVEVTVRLEVVPPEALGDVGTVVVALVDSASGAVVRAQQTTHSEDYRFTFDDPPAGELRVVFGTDWAETGLLGLPGDLLGSLPFGDGRLCLGQASEPACLNPAQAQALLGAAEFVTSPGATWAY